MDIKTLTGLTMEQVAKKLQAALPDYAYKSLPGAARLTDINPAYLWETLTACFGIAGYGWFYKKGGLVTELVGDGTKKNDWIRAMFDGFTLFYRLDVDGEIIVVDGIESNGASENADFSYAVRGATTNALGGAARMLLWQLHVYKGQKKSTKSTPAKRKPPQAKKAKPTVGKDPADIIKQGKAAMAQNDDSPHWITDTGTNKKYHAWLNSHGWTAATAKEALKVESMKDYDGSIGDAFTALTEARA